VAAFSVEGEDGHVADGANDEEEEEDGGDWDIERDGWDAAEGRGSGGIRRILVLRLHGLGEWSVAAFLKAVKHIYLSGHEH